MIEILLTRSVFLLVNCQHQVWIRPKTSLAQKGTSSIPHRIAITNPGLRRIRGWFKLAVGGFYPDLFGAPTLRSTIGAVGLNFSVRNGKRWNPDAIATSFNMNMWWLIHSTRWLYPKSSGLKGGGKLGSGRVSVQVMDTHPVTGSIQFKTLFKLILKNLISAEGSIVACSPYSNKKPRTQKNPGLV